MAEVPPPNNAAAAVTADTGTSTGSIAVDDASAFNITGTYRCTIDSEVVTVTYVDGTHLNLTARGLEGTTAQVHTAGATIAGTLTSGGLAVLLDAVLERAYGSKSAAQSVANNTWTTLALDGTEFLDTNALHYTSGANLTGTVAKTATLTTVVGTGTAFTTELSVGQVISVPGTAAEKRVVTAITDDTHLTVSAAFANTATGQTAARVNSAVVVRTPGTYLLLGFAGWASNATGLRAAEFIKNDLTTSPWNGGMAVASGNAGANVWHVWDLVQWDFVELQGFQSSGGALNCTVAYFLLLRLGATS